MEKNGFLWLDNMQTTKHQNDRENRNHTFFNNNNKKKQERKEKSTHGFTSARSEKIDDHVKAIILCKLGLPTTHGFMASFCKVE